MRTIKKDKLNVEIYKDRTELGKASAETIGNKISELIEQKGNVSIIFASAPSQNEFLEELCKKKINWSKVIAFHMDEYIGIDPDAPQGFANFLREKLFSKIAVKQVHYLNGNTDDPQSECVRYTNLLKQYPPDIVILGIGENTHLAFNDPHVADFNDPEVVKIVDLDEKNRHQQVDPTNKNCFNSIEEVPTHAITITIPALFKTQYAYAIVPDSFKADAVYHTVNSDISENYPSTILRRHENAILYIDENSASKL